MYKIFIVAMVLVISILTGSVNAYAANTGDVIITEIMYHPASSYLSWEWFEIYNTTAGDISLESWTWNDAAGSPVSLPDYTLGAGQWAVIYDGTITTQNFYDAWADAGIMPSRLIDGGNTMGLNDDTGTNGADTIYLWDTASNEIDKVTYDDSSPWPVDDGSASIYLKADKYNYTDNDMGDSWFLSEAGVNGAVASLAAGGNDGGDIGSPGAVPEPSAMMLLIPGLFAVLCLRRIKK